MKTVNVKGAARAAGRFFGGLGHHHRPGTKPKVSSGVLSLCPACPVARKTLDISLASDRNDRLAAKLSKPALVRSSSVESGQLTEAPTQSRLDVREASLAQQDQVKLMFGRMLAVAHELEEAVVAIEDFQRLVEGAAAADVFAVWPFRGSSAACTNMVTAEFYLPDIIHHASQLQRFNQLFPYMELLFSTVSASTLQPNSSPCLHEALSLLAEVYDLAETSQEVKQGIARLMGQWGTMRVPVANDVGVWSSEPEPSRIGSDSRETVLWVVGSLHAERTPTSDCSPSAVQQLVAVPQPPQPFPVPADAPKGLYTAEAVQTIVNKAVQEAVTREQEAQRRALKVRPHGRWAIKKYMRAHTWNYPRDFNSEMLLKKRQRDAIQRELEKTADPMLFTSLMKSADNGSEDLYL